MNFLSVHGLNTKIIVFLSTCACVEFYAKLFAHLTFFKTLKIEGIHGQLKPKKRNKIITSFMEAEKGSVLFATDVVSRGIDFGDVEYIMQLDPPDDPDNFIHRIGRTARVNRVGNALLFL
jgi:ATP-dependent RNA helicase DDX55/SPB4